MVTVCNSFPVKLKCQSPNDPCPWAKTILKHWPGKTTEPDREHWDASCQTMRRWKRRMVEILLPAVDLVGSLSWIPELSGGALGGRRNGRVRCGSLSCFCKPKQGVQGSFLGIVWYRCIFDPLMLLLSLPPSLIHAESPATLGPAPQIHAKTNSPVCCGWRRLTLWQLPGWTNGRVHGRLKG